MDDQGLHDAAILLMSLGEEDAAEVFKHFSPKEVQKLGETIARMRSVSREKGDEVINRVASAAAAQSLLMTNTNKHIPPLLPPPLRQRGGGPKPVGDRYRQLRSLRAQARARRRQGRDADRSHPARRGCVRHREPQVDG